MLIKILAIAVVIFLAWDCMRSLSTGTATIGSVNTVSVDRSCNPIGYWSIIVIKIIAICVVIWFAVSLVAPIQVVRRAA